MNKKTKQNTIALNEIKYLRGMQDFLIDQRNSNRYRIMVKEKIGHTAYCFSVPIYDDTTRKLVCPNFEKTKAGHSFKGSNGTISFHQNTCIFENKDGKGVVRFNEKLAIQSDEAQFQYGVVVTPTLNGMRFIVNGNQLKLSLKSEIKQDGIRSHTTCFSIMSEKYKPFLSISTLYAYDKKGCFSPVQMKYEDKGNQTYDLSFFHEIEMGKFVFEINLYEPKLFQDTTVESLHPDVNNAYGAVGFIGETKEFGEQWLYSRPDFSKIADFMSKRIEHVFFHIPILNANYENVDVFVPERRFCSFGSTWNKKVDLSKKNIISSNRNKYLTIDVTSVFTNHADRTLVYNEGLILKKPNGKNNFIAISTGDCYLAPQILEIKFND